MPPNGYSRAGVGAKEQLRLIRLHRLVALLAPAQPEREVRERLPRLEDAPRSNATSPRWPGTPPTCALAPAATSHRDEARRSESTCCEAVVGAAEERDELALVLDTDVGSGTLSCDPAPRLLKTNASVMKPCDCAVEGAVVGLRVLVAADDLDLAAVAKLRRVGEQLLEVLVLSVSCCLARDALAPEAIGLVLG